VVSRRTLAGSRRALVLGEGDGLAQFVFADLGGGFNAADATGELDVHQY